MPDTHKEQVCRFYDEHPINEEEILAKLVARGLDLDALSEEDLKDFDQDHYCGVQAVETLGKLAGVGNSSHVLDVCSGMGGPARWLAHTIGCHVSGVDLTVSRVESARRLTRRVQLDDLVDFVCGDATAMPLPDASYDALISQESWLHIADKARLVQECVRVLKPGARMAFTDIVLLATLTDEQNHRLSGELATASIAVAETYPELLSAEQCTILSCEDLSKTWARELFDRQESYRALRDTTVAKFGEAHFAYWDSLYSFYAELFIDGKLGGVRMAAQVPG